MPDPAEMPLSEAQCGLELPERLDMSICEGLAEQLMSMRQTGVRLSGKNVTFVGALALQLLLSARLQWQADGHPFVVADPSEAFREGLNLLGVTDFPFEDVTPA